MQCIKNVRLIGYSFLFAMILGIAGSCLAGQVYAKEKGAPKKESCESRLASKEKTWQEWEKKRRIAKQQLDFNTKTKNKKVLPRIKEMIAGYEKKKTLSEQDISVTAAECFSGKAPVVPGMGDTSWYWIDGLPASMSFLSPFRIIVRLEGFSSTGTLKNGMLSGFASPVIAALKSVHIAIQPGDEGREIPLKCSSAGCALPNLFLDNTVGKTEHRIITFEFQPTWKTPAPPLSAYLSYTSSLTLKGLFVDMRNRSKEVTFPVMGRKDQFAQPQQ